jgi:hypothetical protein
LLHRMTQDIGVHTYAMEAGPVGHILWTALQFCGLRLEGPFLLVSTRGPPVRINMTVASPALVKYQLTLGADYEAERAAGVAAAGSGDQVSADLPPRLVLRPLRSWFLRLRAAAQREVLRALAHLQFHGSHSRAVALTDCQCGEPDSLASPMALPSVCCPAPQVSGGEGACLRSSGSACVCVCVDELLTRGLHWSTDPPPDLAIQDAVFTYRLNREMQEQPLMLGQGATIFTDGSDSHNGTPWAVGCGAAVQQSPGVGWRL